MTDGFRAPGRARRRRVVSVYFHHRQGKKMRIMLAAAALLFIAPAASAPVHAQILTVRDDGTGEALINVSLYSPDARASALTDLKGRVALARFRGADSIRFDHIGHRTLWRSYAELEAAGFELRMEEVAFRMSEVVVSATRWRLPEADLPQRVISLFPSDNRLQNMQTTADLLGSSGEVFIQKSQLGGGSPMIRGFATNRVLLAVDGVRMNTAIFRSGNVQNVISLDPFALERADVIFGPGSVSYGSDAVGGVMRFATRTPRLSLNGSPEWEASAAARTSSANGEKTGHADITLSLRNWAALSSVTISDYGDLVMGGDGPDEYLRPTYVGRFDGRDSLVTNPRPRKQTPTGYRQLNLMQKIRFRPDEHWDLQYGFHYSTTSGYSRYDRLLRPRGDGLRSAEWDYGPQDWMMHALTVEHADGVSWYDHLRATLGWQYFAESRHDRDFGGITRYHRSERVDAFSLNLDFEKRFGEDVELFYGLEGVSNLVGSSGEDEDIVTGRRVPGPSRYPDGATWNSVAAYGYASWTVTEPLILQSGFRASFVTMDAEFTNDFHPFPFRSIALRNGAVNGSLGAVYRPGGDWQFDANLSTGFRAPNVDDAGKVFDSTPGSVIVPNPALRPEYAWNAETGVRKRFGQLLYVDLSVFATLLDDAMVRRPFTLGGRDSIIYQGEMSRVEALQNGARASVYGLQTGAELRIARGLQLRSRFTWQRGEEELDDGSTVPLRHAGPWFGSTHLLWTLRGLEIDLSAEYNGSVPHDRLAPEEREKAYLYATDEDGNPWSPAWTTFHLKTRYRLSDAVQLTAGVENILDRRYRPYSSGITAPGRNFIGAVYVTL
jgi:hemoglobin/transferrin/lactoferrin receptor protein